MCLVGVCHAPPPPPSAPPPPLLQAWSCAPRFQRPKVKEWGGGETKLYQTMPGHCFLFDEGGFSSSSGSPALRVVPLEDEPVFFGRDGYGQSGYAYGAAYAQAGMSVGKVGAGAGAGASGLALGAPGAWNWTGTPVL